MQKSLFRDNTGKLRNINLKNETVLKELEPHNLNNCEGICIYVRKCYYDILFNKEGEDKINSKVVLIIEDFGLDQSNKMTNSSYNQKYVDINLEPEIEDKLDTIYYNMIREKTDVDRNAIDNINEHLKVDFDMFLENKNFGGINKNIISYEINICPKNRIAWFYSGTDISKFKELSNEEDIMNIHELQLNNNDTKSENDLVSDDSKEKNQKIRNEITEEKLKNVGIKSLLGGNIYMKSKIANGYDLLNKKREREIYYNKLYNNGNDLEEEKINYENGKYNNIGYYKNNGNENEQNKKLIQSLPIEIQNLIIKMKKKEPITLNIFEKYKAYKKLTCLEFDNDLHHVFIGDNLGNVSCYDISQIYDIMEKIQQDEEERNFENETIITKENLHLFNDISISQLWIIGAHKESIRHIHYIDITPRIIVTTSHDLRIKIFGADDGSDQGEFKQIANRTKPIPIGIKYYLLDPFGEEETTGEAHYFKRKDVIGFVPNKNQDNTSNQQISEVAKKITEYNAKEKLWLATKNANNLDENMSNDWKLKINIEKLQEKEEEEYLEMLEKVAEIEKITNATELILQSRSIYSEAYRPKYIEEMNDIEKIKELSDVIQDRLRNVKLAVSKANLNQSKMVDLTKKKEETNKINQPPTNNKNVIGAGGTVGNKKLPSRPITKSKSALDILKKKTEFSEKKEQTITNSIMGETNERFIKESAKNETNTHINEQIPENEQEQITQQLNLQNKTGTELSILSGLKKNLLPKYPRKFLPEIKSRYAMSRVKLRGPKDYFIMYQDKFDEGYRDLFPQIRGLFARTKETKKQLIKSRSNLVLPGFKVKKQVDIEEEEERLKNEEIERKRKISLLERSLRHLEKNIQ